MLAVTFELPPNIETAYYLKANIKGIIFVNNKSTIRIETYRSN